MYLNETSMSREMCLEVSKGFTEYNQKRFILGGNKTAMTSKDFKTGILFGYELDSQGASTGLRRLNVLDELLRNFDGKIEQTLQTFGAYTASNGQVMDEAGLFIIPFPEISLAELGAIAHSIAVRFRQESVLVFNNYEAEFVYA